MKNAAAIFKLYGSIGRNIHMDYDVIIIGAGPGGIFSAYELSHLNPELKVLVLEKAGRLKNASVPSTGTKSRAALTARSARS